MLDGAWRYDIDLELYCTQVDFRSGGKLSVVGKWVGGQLRRVTAPHFFCPGIDHMTGIDRRSALEFSALRATDRARTERDWWKGQAREGKEREDESKLNSIGESGSKSFPD